MSGQEKDRYTTPVRSTTQPNSTVVQAGAGVGQANASTPIRTYRPVTGAVSERRVATPIRTTAIDQGNKESQASLGGVVGATAQSQTTSYYVNTISGGGSAGATPERSFNTQTQARRDIIPERLFSNNIPDLRKNSGSVTLIHNSTYLETGAQAHEHSLPFGNLPDAAARGNATPISSGKSSGMYRPLLNGTGSIGKTSDYIAQGLRKSGSPLQNKHIPGKLSMDSVFHNGTNSITPQNLFT